MYIEHRFCLQGEVVVVIHQAVGAIHLHNLKEREVAG